MSGGDDPLVPVVGGPSVVRAGDLLFTSARIAAEHPAGLAPDAQNPPGRPFDEVPVKLQTRHIFRELARALEAEGSSLDQLVRLDQFCLGRDKATGYIEGRNEFVSGDRPVSVLVGVEDLVVPGAVIQLDAIAVAAGAQRDVARSPDVPYNAGGGYSQAIMVGDRVFISGSVATDLQGAAPYPSAPGTGLAPEARVDANFWYGSEIKAQVRYVVHEKLAPMLAAGGAGLADIVQAQVYLTHLPEDWAGFREAWAELFGDAGPAVAVYPVSSFGAEGARIEICFTAVRTTGATRPQPVGAGLGLAATGPWPAATRAGDLLYCSTLVAGDELGRRPDLGLHPGLPHHAQPAKAETAHLLGQVAALCADQGGDLGSVVRARALLTRVEDYAPFREAWEEAFGDHRPAVTPVVVRDELPVAGARVALDVVAHVGEGRA